MIEDEIFEQMTLFCRIVSLSAWQDHQDHKKGSCHFRKDVNCLKAQDFIKPNTQIDI